MESRMIAIPVEEYKELLENAIRVRVFGQFVSNSKYSISRKECGMYLGFEVREDDGES